MLEIIISAQPGGAPVAGAPVAEDGAAAMRAMAGPLTSLHALVLGAESSALLHALLDTDCGSATCLRGGMLLGSRGFDIVFAPGIRDIAGAAAVPHLARRALACSGRLVAAVVGAHTGEIRRTLTAGLRREGFAATRSRSSADGFIVRADLPAQLRAKVAA